MLSHVNNFQLNILYLYWQLCLRQRSTDANVVYKKNVIDTNCNSKLVRVCNEILQCRMMINDLIVCCVVLIAV